MADLTPIRVAALTSGRSVPSARFRVRQHIPLLRKSGIEVREYHPWFDKYVAVGLASRLPSLLRPRIARTLRSLSIALRRPGIRASVGADVTWLERELVPGVYSVEGQLGKPLVFDVDDAIWVHRDARPEDLRRIAGEASVVIAGNEHIASWFRSSCNRVEVIPTAVDTVRFAPDQRRITDTFRVGWTGTRSNFECLRWIEDDLARFLESHDAELIVVADRRPVLSRIPQHKLRFERWTPEGEADAVRRFDVGLMPVFDDEWGRGKCGFKALQYMASGIPAIVSPTGFNRVLVETGGAVEAVGHGSWRAVLESLSGDAERRHSIGQAGRAAVVARFSREVISRRIAEVLLSVCSEGLRPSSPKEHGVG